jgi:hypothetical protein
MSGTVTRDIMRPRREASQNNLPRAQLHTLVNQALEIVNKASR